MAVGLDVLVWPVMLFTVGVKSLEAGFDMKGWKSAFICLAGGLLLGAAYKGFDFHKFTGILSIGLVCFVMAMAVLRPISLTVLQVALMSLLISAISNLAFLIENGKWNSLENALLITILPFLLYYISIFLNWFLQSGRSD